MSHRSRRAALVVAAFLTLSVAGSASAYDVADSFSVNGTLTVTGIPANISYGALDAGTTSAVYTIDANVAANTPWEMRVTGTDFARSGGGSLSKHQRQVLLSSTGGGVSFEVSPGPAAWQNFDDSSLTNATADASGGQTAGANVRSELRVAVPANATAGSYSGTITYTFTATP